MIYILLEAFLVDMKKNIELVASEIRSEDLKTTAKDIEKNRAKVAKTAEELKTTSKSKKGIKVKVVKTVEEMKTTAKEIGKTKVKVEKTAENIKTAAIGTEKVRANLAKGAAELKRTAKEKEEVRVKLAEVAKQLVKTAKEKEEVRVKLADTAVVIKELSDRNEAILSSIGDAAFACDKQGIITLFNKMAEEVTGINKKDALGINYDQVIVFINEKTGKPAYDFISDAIKRKKKTAMEMKTLLLRKDGKKIPVEDSAAPIIDSNGAVTGCIVVFRDVTKERSIDRAKTELVSLSSHQLRTPLTAIGWYVELLQSKAYGILTDEQQKLTKEIREAHKRMTTLINSLLNVSRIEMGTFAVEPKSSDTEGVLKTTLELIEHQIDEKKLILKVNYDKKLGNFKADPKILGVIFQNLISNAVKYTPVGGKIEINIQKHKHLEITVSDTGMGIPKYQQSRVFTKLFRADNANNVDPNGTGLGLYIVYEIVKASGGTIWFESVEGKGSTFYVRYPLSGMTNKKGDKVLI